LFPTLRGSARALAAGATAHAAAPLSSLPGRFIGAVLAAEAHVSGWPIPIGGSQKIADALIDDFRAHGGEVLSGHRVTDLRSVWRPGEAAILDTSPANVAQLAGGLLPSRYRQALTKYRYGNAASKVDFILSEQIPWDDRRLVGAGTVHLGGPADTISRAESSARRGDVSEEPFVLLSQPSRFDRSRVRDTSQREVVWSYAHVPNGSGIDATEMIIRRVERFAPGFRDVIESSEARPATWFERHNANYVGGDVLGGRVDVRQFITRPTVSPTPWSTPLRGVYMCSAATPPGAGVHGMGGWHAARVALRDLANQALPDLARRQPKVPL
jgi:phytoene dehydrogenase-like protein